jgi:hypothetical protein
MKKFDPVQLDWRVFATELEEFKTLLDTHYELDENKHILPFFQQRQHLVAGLGFVFNLFNGSPADKIAYEFDLWGKFKCDLVLGCSAIKSYVFIEFEDAKEDSIFKKIKNKSTSEFSNRFEHGYSQLKDWFYILDKMQDNVEYEARFGDRNIRYEGALIIGRKSFLRFEHDEPNRLEWHISHVIVNSKKILILTLDELYELLVKVFQNLKTVLGIND